MLSGIWFYSPPAFDFLPRDASRRVTKSLVFLTLKPIKQYILGFNSVKLCCSNYILPFGTAKSVKSSKIFFFLFFKLLIFFPISKNFDSITPPHQGGNTQLYTRLPKCGRLTCPRLSLTKRLYAYVWLVDLPQAVSDQATIYLCVVCWLTPGCLWPSNHIPMCGWLTHPRLSPTKQPSTYVQGSI